MTGHKLKLKRKFQSIVLQYHKRRISLAFNLFIQPHHNNKVGLISTRIAEIAHERTRQRPYFERASA